MYLLAQVVNDSLVNNPVLTHVTEPAKMNLWEMATKGGWIMIVLALLSVVCIYLFFERWAVLRKAGKQNPLLMERLRDSLGENDLKSAVNYCRAENTPSARVLEKGLKSLERSSTVVRETLDNSANLEIALLEKGIPAINTIAACAPMLGFLGTVTGMVRAFWEMSNAGNNIDVSLLSSGIYEAMITTVGGLIVGIIAIFMHNYLVSLVDGIQNSMEAQIISFLDIVHEKEKKRDVNVKKAEKSAPDESNEQE